MINNMRPIHPGEQLRDELDELGMSGNALALDLRVPANRINDILAGKRGVTADTALRLARYFGTTAEFWMNLQTAYELRQTRRENGERIDKDVKPRAA
jgi:addiction module HigA family antidote